MLRAGARVMAFLAGPPDYARGAVLRQPPTRLPSASSGPTMFDPAFPDSNPYAFGPLAAVSARERGRQASAQPDGAPEAIEVCCFKHRSDSPASAGTEWLDCDPGPGALPAQLVT